MPRTAFRLLAALPLSAVVLLASAPPAQAAETASTLSAKVNRALSGSTARTVGVAVDVAGLGAVVRRSSTVAIPPASTQKLFTAAAALRLLGPGYQQRTDLRTTGSKGTALLTGDVYLVAGGDPFLGRAQLKALATRFAATGVKTVAGHLVVDDTRYDRVRRAPGWKQEWVPEESGPLSAMALDRNAWRRDASYLADPATPVLPVLRSYLSQAGVRFTTADHRRAVVPAAAPLAASVPSVTMATMTTRILKESDNFASELLLKELGKVGRGAGTTADGSKVVHAQTGPGGTVADGSGLSGLDRQTAGNELALVASTFATLKPKVPVGCKDGTLEKRFCGTVAAGRVYAKTGTLDSSRALTGWTYTRDGHLVRFAFLLSGFSSGAMATKAIDRAVVVLAGATVG